jgi:outer membrane protein OmpA-like peptidoglycan-associated protein
MARARVRSGCESPRLGPTALALAALGLSAAVGAGTFACRPALPAQRAAPVDRDGDGVADESDVCPDVPEDRDGFEDWDGCPEAGRGGLAWHLAGSDAGAPEPDVTSLADTDGDGIADLNDACPKEPEDRDGFEDGDGCPDLDNDHDRILDANDKCPNEPETYNGFDDDDGCPDKGSAHFWTPAVTTDPIDFDEGSSAIGADAAKFLDLLAVALIANPNVGTVTIVGHADRRERHARELAAKRAEAVRQGLTARAVPWQRLRTQAAIREERVCARGADCARTRRQVEFQFGD